MFAYFFFITENKLLGSVFAKQRKKKEKRTQTGKNKPTGTQEKRNKGKTIEARKICQESEEMNEGFNQ